MSEHTPGPLAVEDLSLGDKAIVDVRANYGSIGEAYSKDAISGKALPSHANATLWAAAPDLLVYAEKEEERFRHERQCWNCTDDCEHGAELRQEAYALRQAAIAKAKGK